MYSRPVFSRAVKHTHFFHQIKRLFEHWTKYVLLANNPNSYNTYNVFTRCLQKVMSRSELTVIAGWCEIGPWHTVSATRYSLVCLWARESYNLNLKARKRFRPIYRILEKLHVKTSCVRYNMWARHVWCLSGLQTKGVRVMNLHNSLSCCLGTFI